MEAKACLFLYVVAGHEVTAKRVQDDTTAWPLFLQKQKQTGYNRAILIKMRCMLVCNIYNKNSLDTEYQNNGLKKLK